MSQTRTRASLKAAIVPVTPFQQNCTLIWDEQTMRGAIIDPGGDLDRIEDATRQIGLTVERIVLTHGHIDHAGGAKALAARLGVAIEGPHIADKFLLDGLAAQGRQYGFPAEDVTPDRWLAEGDTLAIAGHPFEILHCPGHSPGSVVLLNREQRFLIVGDVLFRGSIGRTDFPRGNHRDLIASIRNKLWPLGDDVDFIPGHGPMSTFGDERRSNPFVADGA